MYICRVIKTNNMKVRVVYSTNGWTDIFSGRTALTASMVKNDFPLNFHILSHDETQYGGVNVYNIDSDDFEIVKKHFNNLKPFKISVSAFPLKYETWWIKIKEIECLD